MKHLLLLLTTTLLLYLLSVPHALSPAEEAAWQQAKAQQTAEIRTIRKDAIEVLCTLDSTLGKTTPGAKEMADRIALKPSGLSVANTVAGMTFHPTVAFGTPAVRVDVKDHNEDAVKVLVGLLASLGIHTDNPPDRGTLSAEELAALIPGVDIEAYARTGTKVESIWDWARMETLSLMETKPAVFKPTAARVKELLKRDRTSAIDYIVRYYEKSQSAAEYFVNQVIPDFEGEESCPKKGAFISSIFFVQLLNDKDFHERDNFIEDLLDRMLPPPGADSIPDLSGRKVESIPVTYYLLKTAYKKILSRRK